MWLGISIDPIREDSGVIEVEQAVKDIVPEILAMARGALLDQGTFLPTAFVHTKDGLFPLLLPFKDDMQKKALVDMVKKEAVRLHAYAVTTITCARIVDTRTGEEEESLVVTTAIRGGVPHIAEQSFKRGDNRVVLYFGEVCEGDSAGRPGQMMILPDWNEEPVH
jgi:hypothetical protein